MTEHGRCSSPLYRSAPRFGLAEPKMRDPLAHVYRLALLPENRQTSGKTRNQRPWASLPTRISRPPGPLVGSSTSGRLAARLSLGFSGTLSVDHSSLDFGSESSRANNNGGSAQQAVTVATGRDFGVRVTNVQITGTDASSFSVQGNGCQGFTLGSNNTCQIYIQSSRLRSAPGRRN